MKLSTLILKATLILLAAGCGTLALADEPPKSEIVRIENEGGKPVTVFTKDQYGQYKFTFSGGAFHSFSSQDGKEYFQEKQGWADSFRAYSTPKNDAFILFKIRMGYESVSVVETSYCAPESTNLSTRKIEEFKEVWQPQFYWSKDGGLLYVAGKAEDQPVRIYDIASGKFKEEVLRKSVDFGALIKIDFKPL